MTTLDLDGLQVRWLAGGLLLRCRGAGLLLDAPAGVVEALGDDVGQVHGIVLTGDRTRAVVGLFPLLAALEPHRNDMRPLGVHFFLGAERGAQLAETWVRGWPGSYPITLDAERAGGAFDAGPFAIESMTLQVADPRWPTRSVQPCLGVGLRVQAEGRTVAWVPGSAPHRHVARLCRGADLAVVEYGRTPWPRTEERWRMTAQEALTAASEAEQVWLAGDDGVLDADADPAS